MATADEMIQALQKEVSDLKLRMKELGEENDDLRELCDRKGIQYKNWLAARRHGRYFARLHADHPMERMAEASDILGLSPLVQEIAGYAGSARCTGMIARCFFAAFTQLTAQFPWMYAGGRAIAT